MSEEKKPRVIYSVDDPIKIEAGEGLDIEWKEPKANTGAGVKAHKATVTFTPRKEKKDDEG